jgi:hypothetical protein
MACYAHFARKRELLLLFVCDVTFHTRILLSHIHPVERCTEDSFARPNATHSIPLESIIIRSLYKQHIDRRLLCMEAITRALIKMKMSCPGTAWETKCPREIGGKRGPESISLILIRRGVRRCVKQCRPPALQMAWHGMAAADLRACIPCL